MTMHSKAAALKIAATVPAPANSLPSPTSFPIPKRLVRVRKSATAEFKASLIGLRQKLNDEEKELAAYIEANPLKTAAEYGFALHPNDKKGATRIQTLINGMLLKTAPGRRMAARGLVSIAPMGPVPYWYSLLPDDFRRRITFRRSAEQAVDAEFDTTVSPKVVADYAMLDQQFSDASSLGRRWKSPAAMAKVVQTKQALSYQASLMSETEEQVTILRSEYEEMQRKLSFVTHIASKIEELHAFANGGAHPLPTA